MSKKVLVTGADGFIGSHLAEALVLKGYDVRALVIYNSLNSWGWLDHSEYAKKMEIISTGCRTKLLFFILVVVLFIILCHIPLVNLDICFE
jgi:dTDP-glucose 4,6-dehydratase